MKVVLQRAKDCQLSIDGKVYSRIDKGLLILLGITQDDDSSDIDWLVKKIINLRIFNDVEGKMNLSVQDIEGSLMVVSQFTLHASTKKGNRPSYIKASKPDHAIPLYEEFVSKCKEEITQVSTGVFGADMKIDFTNDGPVTIIIDSKKKE